MRWHPHRKLLCPFVDQAELLARMRADLISLRTNALWRARTLDETRACEAVDGWISRVLDDLGSRRASVTELELVVAEWRRRREPFLEPAGADVIVVEG